MNEITKEEYDYLVARDLHLSFLEERGVDNWVGFGHPPNRDDYATDEEFQKAFSDAVGEF